MSAANAYTIQEWFKEAVRQKATHMIVVCDTFDHEDYPVYCKSPEECLTQYGEHNGKNMQRVMEVYDIAKGWDKQAKQARVMNLPT